MEKSSNLRDKIKRVGEKIWNFLSLSHNHWKPFLSCLPTLVCSYADESRRPEHREWYTPLESVAVVTFASHMDHVIRGTLASLFFMPSSALGWSHHLLTLFAHMNFFPCLVTQIALELSNSEPLLSRELMVTFYINHYPLFHDKLWPCLCSCLLSSVLVFKLSTSWFPI